MDLRDAVLLLGRSGVPMLFVGGLAVQAYGYSRMTKDCDCLIATADDPRLGAFLQQQGFIEIGRTDTHARYEHEGDAQLLVDTLFVDGSTFARLTEASREVSYAGQAMRVPSPLHLVAMKLHALKQAGFERMGDLVDVIEVLKRQTGGYSREELRAVCERYGPRDIFAQIEPLLHDEAG